MEILGEKIKNLTHTHNVNAETLAGALGVSQTTMFYMFKKRSIESKYLETVCRFFKVPITYFFPEDIHPDLGGGSEVGEPSVTYIKASQRNPSDELVRDLAYKDSIIATLQSEVEFLRKLTQQQQESISKMILNR